MSGLQSAAHYVAGRSVFALRKFLPLSALSVTDPAAVMEAAKREAVAVKAAFFNAPADRKAAEMQIMSIMVGALAANRVGQPWDSAFAFDKMPALFRVWRDAKAFSDSRWQEIRRVANTLISERGTISLGMLGWLLDSNPQRMAA